MKNTKTTIFLIKSCLDEKNKHHIPDYRINNYFKENENLFLIFNNTCYFRYLPFNLKFIYKNLSNISTISFRYKFIILKKTLSCNSDENDLFEDEFLWINRVILYNYNRKYINYNSKFLVSYGLTFFMIKYKICSIIFTWKKNELIIEYSTEDVLLLLILLYKYQIFLDIDNDFLFLNSTKIFTDPSLTKEFNFLNNNNDIHVSNKISLFFSEIPESVIFCEFNDNKILKDLTED